MKTNKGTTWGEGMEQLIASLLEKTLVGGAFIYLLHYFVNKQAVTLDKIADTLGFPFIFKSSYLKDNRSSTNSFQGPGLENGLKILQ